MKSVYVYSLLTVFMFSTFSACKKDKDDEKKDDPVLKTKTELITAKLWKIAALTSGSTDVWNSSFVDACNRDNTYKFKLNDVLTAFDTPVKCSSTDPDSTDNQWTFTDNETRMYVYIELQATVQDTATIVELTENKLILNAKYQSIPVQFTFIPN